MNGIILQTLQDFSLDLYRPIYARELDLGEPLPPKAGNLVKVVVGMRRSGKSYRLLQEIDALRSRGVEDGSICYFNFEDDRLSPVTPATGDAVLEAFYSLHPEALSQGAYLFFDELQEMQGWGAWLRRIVDTRKATIYVTGSSSKMLSTEIATEFRGRAIDFELLPFSFREWAAARGLPVPTSESASFSTEESVRLRAAFGEYLECGGFPGVAGLPRQQAIAVLQSYVQRVVSRDVVERHGFSRPQLVRLFVQRMMASNAKPVSLRKLEGDLRSIGFSTSRETLRDLMGYMEEAYLLFEVRQFSYSASEKTTSQPKVYAVDQGLALANARANSNEMGQRLENAVYLELRRRAAGLRRDAITSYRTKAGGYEVDFVTGDVLDGALFDLYQVSADIADEGTRARELRALWEALDEGGLAEGTLIVADGDDAVYERAGMRIVQVPAWKWFMLRPGRL